MSIAENVKTVQAVELAELDHNASPGKKLLGDNMELIRGVKVKLTVSVGQVDLTVKDLFDLKENTVLPLDRMNHEPVDVLLEGKVVARGNLVVVGENFGVQITEIAGS